MKAVLISLLVFAGMAPLRAHAQFDIGGVNGEAWEREGVMDTWCRDRMAPMRVSLDRATAQYAIGNYAESVRILGQGLARANRNITRPYAHSLTAIVLGRGSALAEQLARYSGATNRGSALFLSEYYEFVFRVANELDRRYYTVGDCGYCRKNKERIREFEELLVRFAKEQVQLPLQKLTSVSDQVYPLGPVRAYLSITEAMTRFAVQDLRGGVYGYEYSCAVGDMESVAGRIAAYLKGSSSAYIDDADAVNSSYYELYDALQEIGCH